MDPTPRSVQEILPKDSFDSVKQYDLIYAANIVCRSVWSYFI